MSALPTTWVETSVGDLFETLGGGTPSTAIAEYWQGTIPWISSADIDDAHRMSISRYISADAIRCSATNLVPAGSVIVVTRVGLGKVSVAETSLCFSQDHQALLINTKFFDTKYVLYFMSQAVKAFKHISRGTTINGVTKKQLLETGFTLPPRPEQTRIVDEIDKQFSRLDAATAALKRVQANLKRYRASVLKAACEGRLVPTEAVLARKEGRDYEPAEKLLQRILRERRARWESDTLAKMQASGTPAKDDRWKQKYKEPSAPDTTNLPELPEGWCWTSLEQLTSLITSGSRGWGDSYAERGPIFVRAQDIKTDRLILDEVAHVEIPDDGEGTRTRLFKIDILVTITGANVTKSALVDIDIDEAYVSQHVGLVRPASSGTSAHIYRWIISPTHGRKELLRLAYGAGKPGLNLENLRSMMVALPPTEEQTRIAGESDRLLSTAQAVEASVEQQTAKGSRVRLSVLQSAFSGQLVPQDPTDEPASVLLERIRAERNSSAKKLQGRRSRKELAHA